MRTLGVIGSTVMAILLWSILYALPTMLLWNWLMPEIFEFKRIDFFQSLGLTFLSGILFKSNNSSND